MGNYNLFAKEYELLTEKLEKQTRKHTHSLITSSLKSKKLLDVGCGSGCDAIYYAKNGADVSGIDISEKEIAMANKKVQGSFIVGDMENLPYNDNAFDIVTSTYAIQASKDVTKAINEMIRVVKKGGEILIVAKHPFRNLLEGNTNDKKDNYFKQTRVTSFIFNRKIKLTEPSHTLMDYINKGILQNATLEIFEEHNDFPASEQVIMGLIYPTFMILKFRKK